MWCKREKLKQLINFVFREILSLSFVFGAYFFEFRGRNLACFVIENPIYYRAFRSGSLHCGPPSAGYRFTESCLVLVLSSLLLPWERLLFFPYKLIFFYFFQADVYSFGLLLCEMCIRELPVPQQIHEQIGLVTNGVLRELIMRCAARDPEARPAISDVISVLTQQAESLRAQGLVTINGRTASLQNLISESLCVLS